MFIKDLQPRQGGVEVEGEVLEMSDVREFSKFGKQGKVANAVIKDGTGTVKLSLWNEQIEKVKVGDTVKITNGYVNEYQGELQLTTGKFGTLEVVGSEEKKQEESAPSPVPEETEQEEPDEPERQKPAPSADEPAPAEVDSGKSSSGSQESLDIEEEDVF